MNGEAMAKSKTIKKTIKKEIKSVGRPAWIPTTEIIDKAESYASRGLSLEQVALCLGISYDTLNEKSKEYVEFSDAIKRGRALGVAHVANKLLANIDGGNVVAQIFYLKCNGMKETNVTEFTGKDGGAIKQEINTKMTLDEINYRIAHLMDKG